METQYRRRSHQCHKRRRARLVRVPRSRARKRPRHLLIATHLSTPTRLSRPAGFAELAMGFGKNWLARPGSTRATDWLVAAVANGEFSARLFARGPDCAARISGPRLDTHNEPTARPVHRNGRYASDDIDLRVYGCLAGSRGVPLPRHAQRASEPAARKSRLFSELRLDSAHANRRGAGQSRCADGN